MAAPKLTILLSGMMAAVPHHGGATWAVLQYVLDFRRLGHDVYFVEPLEKAALQPAGASSGAFLEKDEPFRARSPQLSDVGNQRAES